MTENAVLAAEIETAIKDAGRVLQDFIDWLGPCDHDVGQCRCTDIRINRAFSDKVLDNLPAILAALRAPRPDPAADGAYAERNRLVAAMARLYPSGTRRTAIEGWDPEWHGCVYIDLPTGQVSWHYHDREAHLFADLPPYAGEWDGHTTEEKYQRVAALRSRPEPAAGDVEAVARGLWDYDLSAGLHKGARQWPEARPDQREYYLGLAGAAAAAMAPDQTPDCCPLCGGDCGSANPPVVDCPMRPNDRTTGLRPGDVVAYDVHRWKVCGVHYGAVGQESLIELKSLTHEPGWTGEWEHHPRLFVPEVLLRGLTIVRRP